MKVDIKKVVAQRLSRAWSQQQLADVAEINLRTIQRIESSGNASHDSIQAIASAFDERPDIFIVPADAELIDKSRFSFRFLELSNINRKGMLFSSFIFCCDLFAILVVTLKPTSAIADGKYYFQGNVINDEELMHRFEISMASRNVYMIPLESDLQLMFIAPDDKSSEKVAEARLTRRNGATSYEILHYAKISISAASNRTFSLSYRACGDSVIFYNHDKDDIPTCTESELAT